MLAAAIDAARATDGLVTPSVGGAVLAAGYDRDFSALNDDGPAGARRGALPRVAHGYAAGMLLRTEPVVLDLNGVVKGLHG